MESSKSPQQRQGLRESPKARGRPKARSKERPKETPKVRGRARIKASSWTRHV